jgi:PPM family protein phosphatase
MKIKELAYKTDIGKVRNNNEDYILVDEDSRIFIIADGMGGTIGGEVASKTAVTIIYKLLKDRLTETEIIDQEEINDYINQTNRIVYEKGVNESLTGMGTTLIAGYLTEDILRLVHTGDSRVYMIRNKNIIQLTQDHSVVEELVKKKLITREEAREHHLRHMITKVIGSRENIVPDFLDVDLKKGDLILMCTDGLSEMLNDEQILSVVLKNKTANQKCDDLVATSNKEGGLDNISVILIQL